MRVVLMFPISLPMLPHLLHLVAIHHASRLWARPPADGEAVGVDLVDYD